MVPVEDKVVKSTAATLGHDAEEPQIGVVDEFWPIKPPTAPAKARLEFETTFAALLIVPIIKPEFMPTIPPKLLKPVTVMPLPTVILLSVPVFTPTTSPVTLEKPAFSEARLLGVKLYPSNIPSFSPINCPTP